MLIRRSPVLLLVVACVIASVLVSDAVSTRSWLAGGHATPDQLALHVLYVSMGIHDHHGHAPATAEDDGADRGAVFTTTPAITVAIRGGAADPGQFARDFRSGAGVVLPVVTVLARLVHTDDPCPDSADFLVSDPPPRLAA